MQNSIIIQSQNSIRIRLSISWPISEIILPDWASNNSLHFHLARLKVLIYMCEGSEHKWPMHCYTKPEDTRSPFEMVTRHKTCYWVSLTLICVCFTLVAGCVYYFFLVMSGSTRNQIHVNHWCPGWSLGGSCHGDQESPMSCVFLVPLVWNRIWLNVILLFSAKTCLLSSPVQLLCSWDTGCQIQIALQKNMCFSFSDVRYHGNPSAATFPEQCKDRKIKVPSSKLHPVANG